MSEDEQTREETEREQEDAAEKTDNEGGEGIEHENEDEGAGAGPTDDIQNDPAYNPDDPELKGIKGG
jgi:hypothetical protein